MTFWDAGEFIAAANGLGIPHPPGTPLYVLLGHVWLDASSSVLGAARAMNVLSALATAAAGGLTAALVVRETAAHTDAWWGAVAGALCAGLMATAWANATETEVYAVALLHVAAMLTAAARAADEADAESRWLLCTAYLIALAPALHLSALVGAPAAVALASRRVDGRWRQERAAQLAGALVLAAGVGRMSWPLCVVGAVLALLPVGRPAAPDARAHAARRGGAVVMLALIGATALLAMMVRARHDPLLNQGNPATLATLAAVVARRQYDVAPLLPRRAPVWLQLANVAQYADWQIALGWGRGIFTSPARVLAGVAFVTLSWRGARALRGDARRLGDALVVLLVCGTLGVAAYLNLKAGASLGWGLLAEGVPHEARERDYFFVLGFWAWGCLAGYGALALARARRWHPALACAAVLLPLTGNWRAVDRSRPPDSDATRRVALALLGAAPANAVLFAGGDNDSYPLWYAQQVEAKRRDVLVVTLPLLPADWYADELRRRTGARWTDRDAVPGARLLTEQRAALVARWAAQQKRPVVASPAVTAAERAFLGGAWTLRGPLYYADGSADGIVRPARIDSAASALWLAQNPAVHDTESTRTDGAVRVMTALLECPRLALPARPGFRYRDSLELRCNLR